MNGYRRAFLGVALADRGDLGEDGPVAGSETGWVARFGDSEIKEADAAVRVVLQNVDIEAAGLIVIEQIGIAELIAEAENRGGDSGRSSRRSHRCNDDGREDRIDRRRKDFCPAPRWNHADPDRRIQRRDAAYSRECVRECLKIFLDD